MFLLFFISDFDFNISKIFMQLLFIFFSFYVDSYVNLIYNMYIIHLGGKNMLRKMCKKCAPKGSANYANRKLTGEVTNVWKCGDCTFPKIIKLVTCTECGRQWTFSRTRY